MYSVRTMGTTPLYVAANGVKHCYRCKTDKPVDQFYRYTKFKFCPYSATCKGCQKADRRRRYAASDKQKHYEGNLARKMVREYGITLRRYLEMLKNQGGRCAICKGPPQDNKRLAVDHCHVTGAVRGLLCRSCNTAIGNMKDDPELLELAAAYVRSARDESAVPQISVPSTT